MLWEDERGTEEQEQHVWGSSPSRCDMAQASPAAHVTDTAVFAFTGPSIAAPSPESQPPI